MLYCPGRSVHDKKLQHSSWALMFYQSYLLWMGVFRQGAKVWFLLSFHVATWQRLLKKMCIGFQFVIKCKLARYSSTSISNWLFVFWCDSWPELFSPPVVQVWLLLDLSGGVEKAQLVYRGLLSLHSLWGHPAGGGAVKGDDWRGAC